MDVQLHWVHFVGFTTLGWVFAYFSCRPVTTTGFASQNFQILSNASVFVGLLATWEVLWQPLAEGMKSALPQGGSGLTEWFASVTVFCTFGTLAILWVGLPILFMLRVFDFVKQSRPSPKDDSQRRM